MREKGSKFDTLEILPYALVHLAKLFSRSVFTTMIIDFAQRWIYQNHAQMRKVLHPILILHGVELKLA